MQGGGTVKMCRADDWADFPLGGRRRKLHIARFAEGQQKLAHFAAPPLPTKSVDFAGFPSPRIPAALTLPPQFQRFYDGIFDLLRGRPRRKEPGYLFFRHFKLLHLIRLFLL